MNTLPALRVAELSFLQGLSACDIAEMLSLSRRFSYARGTDVFEQDQEAQWFFVLLEGRLRVTRLTPAGQQVVVRYVVPGEVFGVAMAFGRPTYPASATAVVESAALGWGSAMWPDLVSKFPSLAMTTLRSIGARLQDAHDRVVEMSTEEVERRIAHALLRLAKQAGRRIANGIQIDFPITRQDVAEMTGTTLHTVSRTLSAWESRGLVEGSRKKIVIRDAHNLLILAERAAE
jgi:CRP-like cAMP-binding protein